MYRELYNVFHSTCTGKEQKPIHVLVHHLILVWKEHCDLMWLQRLKRQLTTNDSPQIGQFSSCRLCCAAFNAQQRSVLWPGNYSLVAGTLQSVRAPELLKSTRNKWLLINYCKRLSAALWSHTLKRQGHTKLSKSQRQPYISNGTGPQIWEGQRI